MAAGFRDLLALFGWKSSAEPTETGPWICTRLHVHVAGDVQQHVHLAGDRRRYVHVAGDTLQFAEPAGGA